jgi:hypothetical protein
MRHERFLHAAPLLLTPCCAFGQDMVGPSWLDLVLAVPLLAAAAIGELTFSLLPLLFAATVASWAHARWRPGAGRKAIQRTHVLALITVLATVPALLYWTSVGRHDAATRFGAGYVSSSTPDRRVDALDPPAGTSWPDETGYLALPQQATGGSGVIRISRVAGIGPVYVKLCVAREAACPGLRHAFVVAGEQFSFRDVAAGDYEIRYLRIDRPLTAGRSRPLSIPDWVADPVVVALPDALTIGSLHDPVVGMTRAEF